MSLLLHFFLYPFQILMLKSHFFTLNKIVFNYFLYNLIEITLEFLVEITQLILKNISTSNYTFMGS